MLLCNKTQKDSFASYFHWSYLRWQLLWWAYSESSTTEKCLFFHQAVWFFLVWYSTNFFSVSISKAVKCTYKKQTVPCVPCQFHLRRPTTVWLVYRVITWPWQSSHLSPCGEQFISNRAGLLCLLISHILTWNNKKCWMSSFFCF